MAQADGATVVHSRHVTLTGAAMYSKACAVCYFMCHFTGIGGQERSFVRYQTMLSPQFFLKPFG